MEDRILPSIKKLLGVDDSYEIFDTDILLYINAAIGTLNQIGVGPEDGFMVMDKTATWVTFLGDDPRLNSAKAYVYLRVKLLFDPPTTSYLIEANAKLTQEFEWRLNTLREETGWTDPDPDSDFPDDDLVLDGGIP